MNIRSLFVAVGVVAIAVLAATVNVALLNRASGGPAPDDGLAASLVSGAPTSTTTVATASSIAVTSTSAALVPDPGDVSSPEGRRYHVGRAGVVTLRPGGGITVLAVQPAEGWSFAYERRETNEVRIIFTHPSEGSTRFRAEVKSDGELRVEIGDGADD